MSRPKKEYEYEELKQIAMLRHEDGKQWKEIAAILHVQDPERYAKLTDDEVSRMDLRAREDKIITFHYAPPETKGEKLGKALIQLLPFLKRVEIVDDEPSDDYGLLLQKFAKHGAEYFDLIWDKTPRKQTLRVGISGGMTLAAFANKVDSKNRPNVEIHALALVGQGGEAPPVPGVRQFAHVNPIVTATALWMRCGSELGKLKYATVTPIDRQRDKTLLFRDQKRLKEDRGIRQCLKDMETIDFFFCGIGKVEPTDVEDELAAQLSMSHLLYPVVRREDLVAAGIVGELSYNFFDHRGTTPCEGKFDYILTPGSLYDPPQGVNFYADIVDPKFFYRDAFWRGDDTQRPPRVKKSVIVMAGRGKEDALRAALRGALFNVWITDYPTALSIYEQLREELELLAGDAR